jgi:hypothetical protein
MPSFTPAYPAKFETGMDFVSALVAFDDFGGGWWSPQASPGLHEVQASLAGPERPGPLSSTGKPVDFNAPALKTIRPQGETAATALLLLTATNTPFP